MQRADSLEKILMLGRIEGRGRGQQRMSCLESIIDSMDMSLSKLQKMVKDREAWRAVVHRVAKNQNRSNVVINSIKTLKMSHIKKKSYKKISRWRDFPGGQVCR